MGDEQWDEPPTEQWDEDREKAFMEEVQVQLTKMQLQDTCYLSVPGSLEAVVEQIHNRKKRDETFKSAKRIAGKVERLTKYEDIQSWLVIDLHIKIDDQL